MLISIIIASKNEGAYLKRTINSINQAKTSLDYEVIAVDDASVDDSCEFLLKEDADYKNIKLIKAGGIGIAPARNLGAAKASGDIFIFMDAHNEVDDSWLDILLAPLLRGEAHGASPAFRSLKDSLPEFMLIATAGDSLACGRTFKTLNESGWIYHGGPCPGIIESPILAGACTAVTREAFEMVGGYDPGLSGYGYDEEELSLKLWMYGFRLLAVPETCVRHLYPRIYPYESDPKETLKNRILTAICHYNDERINRFLEGMDNMSEAYSIYSQLMDDNGIIQRKNKYREERKHDDDWFFNIFGLAF